MSGAVEGVALLPEWVGQKHKCGCMAAVAAMILGVDYDAAALMLTDMPDSLDSSASGYFVLESRLVDNGYAVARKWAVTQPGNKRRDQWPAEPWADVHWCEVMAGATNGYAHAVLMLRDGTVLDPMTPQPRRLSDYEAVNFIAAVIPVRTTPPARSYADGVEDAAKVCDERAAGRIRLYEENQALINAFKASEAEDIAAAIRLLSQGGKA